MSVFGKDKGINCILVPLEGTTEQVAIFMALVDVLPKCKDWWRGIYWGDVAHKHKILVLCRTQKILNKVGVVIDIPESDVEGLKSQADEKGLRHHEVKVKDLYAMVYY